MIYVGGVSINGVSCKQIYNKWKQPIQNLRNLKFIAICDFGEGFEYTCKCVQIGIKIASSSWLQDAHTLAGIARHFNCLVYTTMDMEYHTLAFFCAYQDNVSLSVKLLQQSNMWMIKLHQRQNKSHSQNGNFHNE